MKLIIQPGRWLQSLPLRTNRRLQSAITVAIIFVITYLILAVVTMPARVRLEVGRPSSRTIYAPRDFIDEYVTEQLRQAAEEAVPDVYDYDEAVRDGAVADLEFFFQKTLSLQADASLEPEDRLTRLQQLFSGAIPASPDLKVFLAVERETLRDLQLRLAGLVEEIMEQGIKEGGVETARRYAYQEIALFPFSAEVKRVSEKMLDPLITPNMLPNPAATALNRELARQQVEPVLILRGTLLISEGETVTAKHLAQLSGLGLVRGGQTDYPAFFGLLILLLILFTVIGIYLAVFVKNIFDSLSAQLLLGLVLIVTLIFAIAATYFSGYLIPVAMGAILITVMFGYKPAVMMNVVLSVLVGLITGGDFVFVVVALVGGMVAIFGVSRISQRSDLAKAGIYVSAANVAVIVASFLLLGNLHLEYSFIKEFGYGLLAGIGNGIFSAVIAIGLLPYLESGFGLTTAITLLELSNPNKPLLRQLQMKAPGTYYHSIMVGNLAEAAAEVVGADPLLARVGAYYHDIGKLKRPYFFTENQLAGDNPHEKISPNLSALIIASHVKDGLELGRRHRLPALILDIIAQHHGTGLISFFYQQALESGRPEEVPVEKFRYEGPLPQTKEAAIIALADAVEAGVRSLSKPVGSRVEGLIRRIIKEKLNDGQMDECDLTLKELDKIGDSFVYILSGIYHSRVEYPEKDLRAEIERSAAR